MFNLLAVGLGYMLTFNNSLSPTLRAVPLCIYKLSYHTWFLRVPAVIPNSLKPVNVDKSTTTSIAIQEPATKAGDDATLKLTSIAAPPGC